MEYRILGKTGLNVSMMGLGGIPIQRIDAAGTRVLVEALVANGINYIDTARGYSVSEEYLGHALDGLRDKFIIATKSMARTKDSMAKDIDISLCNLKTEYIDLYQVHNPTLAQLEQVAAEGGALEALQDAKKAGKVRHIGLTAHSVEVFEKAISLDWVETIMFPYNIVETQGEELIKRCAEKNIGFIVMKPLAGGAIEDPTLAMRFISANPNVSVIIPGMAEVAELTQNLAAVNDTAPLSCSELEKINSIRKELGTQFCRRCGYCAPCSVGISIPSMFLFEGYLKRYGLADWARGRYEAMAKTASDCIGCGLCEERCPYNLPIREMLKRTAKAFGK